MALPAGSGMLSRTSTARSGRVLLRNQRCSISHASSWARSMAAGWSLAAIGAIGQLEPVEPVGAEGEQVGQRANGREADPTHDLDRDPGSPARKVQLHVL